MAFYSGIQKIKTQNKETSPKNLLFFVMRIPSEINPFKQGDTVIVKDDPDLGVGIISRIHRSSVYYEARPIASYDKYTIYVRFLGDEDGSARCYRIDDLKPSH